MTQTRRLAAILAADVAGYSRLMRADEEGTHESFKAHQDGELADLAWLYNMNRGVYMTPGREEEWTLSVAHTPEDCDIFIAAFDAMAADLTR